MAIEGASCLLDEICEAGITEISLLFKFNRELTSSSHLLHNQTWLWSRVMRYSHGRATGGNQITQVQPAAQSRPSVKHAGTAALKRMISRPPETVIHRPQSYIVSQQPLAIATPSVQTTIIHSQYHIPASRSSQVLSVLINQSSTATQAHQIHTIPLHQPFAATWPLLVQRFIQKRE
jgi:hypothetical protein